MIIGDGVLTTNAFDSLSELHRTNLGESSLSLLGRRILNRYYRFVVESGQEYLFTIRHDDEIRAAAVLSLDPESLSGRFARKEFLAFPMAVAWNSLTNPAFRTCLRKQIKAVAAPEPDGAPGSPELVQIFVAAKNRGQSLGTRLLTMIEDQVASLGLDHYVARTHQREDNLALKFYRRNGFTEFKRDGDPVNGFVHFRKDLSNGL